MAAVICAWCCAVIKGDDGKGGRNSHGICRQCSEAMLKKAGISREGEK